MKHFPLITKFNWKELDGKMIEVKVQETEELAIVVGIDHVGKQMFVLALEEKEEDEKSGSERKNQHK